MRYDYPDYVSYKPRRNEVELQEYSLDDIKLIVNKSMSVRRELFESAPDDRRDEQSARMSLFMNQLYVDEHEALLAGAMKYIQMLEGQGKVKATKPSKPEDRKIQMEL